MLIVLKVTSFNISTKLFPGFVTSSLTMHPTLSCVRDILENAQRLAVHLTISLLILLICYVMWQNTVFCVFAETGILSNLNLPSVVGHSRARRKEVCIMLDCTVSKPCRRGSDGMRGYASLVPTLVLNVVHLVCSLLRCP